MVNSGSMDMSGGWYRCSSGGAARLVTIHLLAEHLHDTFLFVHRVLVLVDEDANLILKGVDLFFAMANSSS